MDKSVSAFPISNNQLGRAYRVFRATPNSPVHPESDTDEIVLERDCVEIVRVSDFKSQVVSSRPGDFWEDTDAFAAPEHLFWELIEADYDPEINDIDEAVAVLGPQATYEAIRDYLIERELI
jgi:hypothetical protein